MSAKINICMIGCGKTATKHAKALLKCGFKITHVFNHSNKKRIKDFSKKFKIKNIISSKKELFKKDLKVDAFVLVVPPQNLEEYTKNIIELKKPALIEKPVSTDLKFLEKYKNNKYIMVGFSKRYYQSILNAKKFIKKKNKFISNIILPETVNPFSLRDKQNMRYTKHFTNSIHVFDLISWMFGKIYLIKKQTITFKDKVSGYLGIFKDTKNNYINLFSAWNSSENYSISICSDKTLYKISPLEIGKIYEDFDIQITSKNTKNYMPKLIKKFSDNNKTFADGFFLQAKLFYKFCKNPIKTKVPLINDALEAQKIAYKLIYN